MSWNIGLPIFNNDAIRSEVREDLGSCLTEVYAARRNERLRALLATRRSLLEDSSVDRDWDAFKTALDRAGYEAFVISLDLSRDHLERMYLAKGYHESLQVLDCLMAEHETFVQKNRTRISFTITEATFGERLER